MAGGLDWLMKLDSIAVKPGDGLNPKLAELLMAERMAASHDVVRLPGAYASAGLGSQTYSDEDLSAAGIAKIGDASGSSEQILTDPASSEEQSTG
ncbi:MAG: hypothetical protein AAF557_12965 [Pseudomonadota bacterium]